MSFGYYSNRDHTKLETLYPPGAVDSLCEVDPNLLDEIEADVCETPTLIDPTFTELANRIMLQLGIQPPQNAAEACWAYFGIVQTLESMSWHNIIFLSWHNNT